MHQIKFHIDKSASVKILIKNDFGRMLDVLEFPNLPEGDHEVPWQAPFAIPGELFKYNIEVDGSPKDDGMLIVK